jgi:hypothetical protein
VLKKTPADNFWSALVLTVLGPNCLLLNQSGAWLSQSDFLQQCEPFRRTIKTFARSLMKSHPNEKNLIGALLAGKFLFRQKYASNAAPPETKNGGKADGETVSRL